MIKKCSKLWRPYGVMMMAAGLAIGLMGVPTVSADEEPLFLDIQSDANKIHIQSDKLIANSDKNIAEFIGNVRATRGTTVITCKQLNLYFKEGSMADSGASPDNSSIERIIAKDNVKIRMDDRLAFSDIAEYMLSTGDIILTGTPAKVYSGNTFITGHKITMTSDNQINVQPAPGEQVEAVLYQKNDTQKQ